VRNITRLEAAVLLLAIVDAIASLGTLSLLHPVGVAWLWPPAVGDLPSIQVCSSVLWISMIVLCGMSVRLWIRRREGVEDAERM